MFRRKITFPECADTPERRRAHVRIIRREDARKTKLNTAMAFWVICRVGKCRRAHACTADPAVCFQEKWRLMPEDFKQSVRDQIRAAARRARNE